MDKRDLLHRKAYDLLAAQYDEKAKIRRANNETSVRHFTHFITTGNKVVDIGCAVGLDTQIFTELGYEATGIDISGEMVRIARRRNPEADIVEGDFFNLDLQKGNFDAAYAQDLIHLYPSDQASAVLNRISYLLKPEGVAHIATTRHDTTTEGWEVKSDYDGNVSRYRTRWASSDLAGVLRRHFDLVESREVTDADGKDRIIYIVRKV